MREEFRLPRRCTPPSTRTFPGTREVMINSGLALSPPARVPPRSTPCSAAPFRLCGPGRARRSPVTVNSGWRPLGSPAPAAPFRRSPADPYRSPRPGTPAASTPAGSAACSSSNPRLKARPLRNVSYVPSNSSFLFKHTTNLRRRKIPL